MVIGGHLLVDEKDGRILEKWQYDTGTPWHKYRNSAPWGRVYRREIIEQNKLRFMQTRISEDFYFNVVYMSCCAKVHVTPYIGYGWTYRASSESHHNMSRYLTCWNTCLSSTLSGISSLLQRGHREAFSATCTIPASHGWKKIFLIMKKILS